MQFLKILGVYVFTTLGLSEQFLMVWNTMRWLASSLILFVIFVGLYWIAPNIKLKCLSVVPGALFSTIGWQLSSLAFSYYVSSFGNYTATYGSIGAIIVLMLWFYLTGIVIIIGGEINAAYSKVIDEKC